MDSPSDCHTFHGHAHDLDAQSPQLLLKCDFWNALCCNVVIRLCSVFLCLCMCGFSFLAFRLQVNDKRYHVQPPKRVQLSMEDTSQVGDVRALVSQVNKVCKTTMKLKRCLWGSCWCVVLRTSSSYVCCVWYVCARDMFVSTYFTVHSCCWRTYSDTYP